jgi:type VI protein secretion system component Hcp
MTAELPPRPAQEVRMAFGHYLKIDGIAGESTNPEYRDSIEVLSWSVADQHQHAGYRSDNPMITFVKNIDGVSAVLRNAYASGKHFDKAVLASVKHNVDVDSSERSFLKFTLTDVMVGWLAIGNGDEGMMESFSLVAGGFAPTYGALPPEQTTVQPDHQHLISRLKFLTQRGKRR